MWTLVQTDRLANRRRKLEKKHGGEVAQMFKNLGTYVVSLDEGVKPMQMFKHSFVHNEKKGVHAIDQSPLKKGAKALRLYVYPDVDECELHLITMGDKDQQPDDVNECCDYVDTLIKRKKK